MQPICGTRPHWRRAYSDVYRCLDQGTGKLVAVKVLREAHVCRQIMRMVSREVQLLRSLDHPNIVKLLSVSQSRSGHVRLVFENMETTLYGELGANPNGLPPAILKAAAWQLVRAVGHLHDKGIMHRDIKPANVLLNGNGIVKVCDFGFARRAVLGTHEEALTSYVATRWYRAPEILSGYFYGPSSDVWSIGCTLAEMATGSPLFPGDTTADQLYRIERCVAPLRMADNLNGCSCPRAVAMPGLRLRLARLPMPLYQVVEACLQPDPRQRPSCAELLQMPYFCDMATLVCGTAVERLLPRGTAQQSQPAVPVAAPIPPSSRKVAGAAIPAAAPAAPSHQRCSVEFCDCGLCTGNTSDAGSTMVRPMQARDTSCSGSVRVVKAMTSTSLASTKNRFKGSAWLGGNDVSLLDTVQSFGVSVVRVNVLPDGNATQEWEPCSVVTRARHTGGTGGTAAASQRAGAEPRAATAGVGCVLDADDTARAFPHVRNAVSSSVAVNCDMQPVSLQMACQIVGRLRQQQQQQHRQQHQQQQKQHEVIKHLCIQESAARSPPALPQSAGTARGKGCVRFCDTARSCRPEASVSLDGDAGTAASGAEGMRAFRSDGGAKQWVRTLRVPQALVDFLKRPFCRGRQQSA